jgi:hypothetical protein
MPQFNELPNDPTPDLADLVALQAAAGGAGSSYYSTLAQLFAFVVLVNGSQPLTADWDAGDFRITAGSLVADTGIGVNIEPAYPLDIAGSGVSGILGRVGGGAAGRPICFYDDSGGVGLINDTSFTGIEGWYLVHSTHVLQTYCNGTLVTQHAPTGLQIGSAVQPTGTATKVLSLGDNAGDPTPGSNTACIYAKDVAGTVTLYAINEGGTAYPVAPQDLSTEGSPKFDRIAVGLANVSSNATVNVEAEIIDPASTANIAQFTTVAELTANNAQVIRGVAASVRIDQAGFNHTNSVGLRGFLNTTFVTGASGTVTGAAGSYSNTGNLGAGSLTNGYNYFSDAGLNNGGGTLTSIFGYYQADFTAGNNAYAFYGNVSSGSNKWNCYMAGTAPNYFNGVILVGTTTLPTGTATKVITLGDNAGNPTMGSNTAGIFAKDVTGTVEVFVIDEAGTATQISEHAGDAPAWFYDHADGMRDRVAREEHDGKIRWSNRTRMERLLQKLVNSEPITGSPQELTFTHIETYGEYLARRNAEEFLDG